MDYVSEFPESVYVENTSVATGVVSNKEEKETRVQNPMPNPRDFTEDFKCLRIQRKPILPTCEYFKRIVIADWYDYLHVYTAAFESLAFYIPQLFVKQTGKNTHADSATDQLNAVRIAIQWFLAFPFKEANVVFFTSSDEALVRIRCALLDIPMHTEDKELIDDLLKLKCNKIGFAWVPARNEISGYDIAKKLAETDLFGEKNKSNISEDVDDDKTDFKRIHIERSPQRSMSKSSKAKYFLDEVMAKWAGCLNVFTTDYQVSMEDKLFVIAFYIPQLSVKKRARIFLRDDETAKFVAVRFSVHWFLKFPYEKIKIVFFTPSDPALVRIEKTLDNNPLAPEDKKLIDDCKLLQAKSISINFAWVPAVPQINGYNIAQNYADQWTDIDKY